MKRSRRGLTLLEVMTAIAIFTVLVVVILMIVSGLLRMISSKDAVTTVNQQGNQALHGIATHVSSALLPVYVAKTEAERSNADSIYFNIDDRRHGFSNDVGKKWAAALREGVDAIAFVVPIDFQGVGDYLDDGKHLQLGQARSLRTYLGSVPVGLPGSGAGFLVRDPDSDELTNAVAAVDPYRLNSPAAEAVADPPDWEGLVGDASADWPTVACFMVVRFVPRVDKFTGEPVVLRERGLGPNGNDVDLDGDGNADGEFQLGRMQLVYTGGRMPYAENGLVQWEEAPQIAVNLTSDMVLRRREPTERTPIFRLVNFESRNIDRSPGGAGAIVEGGEEGGAVLSVKLLVLDTRGIDNDTLRINPYVKNLEARWFETKVVMRNMAR